MYSYYVYYCILVVFCFLGLKVLHGLINQSINHSINLSHRTLDRAGSYTRARAPTLSPPLSLSHRTIGRAGRENETTVHSILLLYQFTFHPANRSQI